MVDMSKLFNIVEGWGKSIGLFDVSPDERKLSIARMKVCAGCDQAKKSKILVLLKGNAHALAALHCTLCKCPVNEKSLVKKEECPLKKWENIFTN
jgi:hypothetical protein